MTRDGLPRAYLRIDPNIDQTHPDNLDGFIRLMCAAARQPERGRFRTRVVLESLLGRALVRKLYARGDLADLSDGRVYLPGWDEWQEGDHTVAERMHRMRQRRKAVTTATVLASPDRIGVTTDAGTTTDRGTSLGVDVDVDVSPPPQVGRRKDGTNPRSVGTNPRATGTSPRQEREAAKRGPTALADILRHISAEDVAVANPSLSVGVMTDE